MDKVVDEMWIKTRRILNVELKAGGACGNPKSANYSDLWKSFPNAAKKNYLVESLACLWRLDFLERTRVDRGVFV